MKKFLFLLLVTLVSCISEPKFAGDNNQQFSFDEGVSPMCNCACLNYFSFGTVAPGSYNWIVNNKHVTYNITTRPYPMSLTIYKTGFGGIITYRINNLGTSTFRYKNTFGSWVTLTPGTFGVITRNIIPFGCNKNVGVETIAMEVERLTCAADGSGQFVVEVDPYSVWTDSPGYPTYGHTVETVGAGNGVTTYFGGQICN